MKKNILFFLFIFLFIKSSFSQANCDTAVPFCNSFGSPATVVSGGFAEVGPDYGCLGSQPNPSWSLLKIESAGDLEFEISQVTSSGVGIDVDFISYGPFSDPVTPCQTGQLTAANTIDCSFSSSAIENFTIPNAQVDEYYLILITNFDGLDGILTFEQTNARQPDSGVSDCSIVCAIELEEDKTFCFDYNHTLTTTLGNSSIADNATYTWFKNTVEILGETTNELVLIPSSTPTIDIYRVELDSADCDDIASDEIQITYTDPFSNFNLMTIPDLLICDTDNDDFAQFNLTDNEIAIANTENPLDYTFTYFTDTALTNQITAPTVFTNTINNTQTIYLSITHNTFIGCTTNTSFTINVAKTPIANTVSNWFACDDDLDGFFIFDFSTLNNQVLNGQDATAYTITYHNSQAEADANQNALNNYTNATANTLEPIFVRIENTIFPTCFDTSTFNINIIRQPTANPVLDWMVCDEDNDGFTPFDLSTLNSQVLNGQNASTFIISYHQTQTEANTNTNALSLPYTNQVAFTEEILFVRIETALNTNCFDTNSFKINTFQTPTANTVSNWLACDDDLDGFFIFDFSTLNNQVLNGQDATAYTITYHNSQAEADANQNALNNYTNAAAHTLETIFIRIENTNFISCYNTSQFDINVLINPTANPVLDWIICDEDNDGFTPFDLSTLNSQVLNGQNASAFIISYHQTQTEADTNTNALSLPHTTQIAFTEETLFVRIETALNANCFDTNSFKINTIQTPIFDVVDTKYICVNLLPQDVLFEVENAQGAYSYSWKDALGIELSNQPIFTATIDGDYTITATTTDGNMCETTKTVHLLPAEPATITDFTINEYWTDNNFSLDIEVTGTGSYEYALNSSTGPFQEEAFFFNIAPGIHEVFIREKNNCGMTSKMIDIFGYPNFFTPNNDGINDIWKVQGIKFKSSAKIYIFDRFGKLITVFTPALNQGWNGTFKNKNAPETDYWFTAEMVDYKGNDIIRTGHFSLKR